MKKLYFITNEGIKSYKDKTIKNTKQLILKYYDINQPETYYLNETVQCTYGKQRSFEDIYSICKTRFSKTTKNIVARALIDLCKKNLLKCQYCGNIHECVFHRIKDNWTYISKKEFNIYSTRSYKYSINTIYNLSKSN